MSGNEKLQKLLAAKGRGAATSSQTPPERRLSAAEGERGSGRVQGSPGRSQAFSGPPPALIAGDCRVVLKEYPDAFHAIICDPGVGSSVSRDGWVSGVPGDEFWKSAMAATRPGGHLAIFSGRKTDHRVKTHAENVGWEIRDTLMWVYPKGMPMAIDVGQAVDRKMGGKGEPYFRTAGSMTDEERAHLEKSNPWYGWGTELRPTWEPIALFRKPLSEGSVANNVIENSTGAMNIDATRIPAEERDAIATYIPPGQGEAHGLALTKYQQVVGKTSLGRWPADALFSHADGCSGNSCAPGCAVRELELQADGAAKFFYCPKASRGEKDAGIGPKGNTSKSVKPRALMEWLVDLLVPANGALCDPFMGTGSTGLGLIRLDGSGVRPSGSVFVGIDQDPRMVEFAQARFTEALKG